MISDKHLPTVILATVTIAIAALALTGCPDDKKPGTTPSASSSATPAATTSAPAAGSAKTGSSGSGW